MSVTQKRKLRFGETVMALHDTIYMEYINPKENSKKFYEMVDLGNGNWLAKWGRIGTKGQSKEFPMGDWDKKESEKKGEGYQEVRRTPNQGLPSSAPKPSPTAPAPASPPKPSAPVKKDPENEKRIQMVYDVIKSSKKSADSFDLNLLNSIRRSFDKTGILKQDSMLALNTIFKKYK